uniref:Maltose/maltodextrin ABC transporter, substrate binding periplasmic protein MalE n=1 Tax=Rheinheimera sp. BAL341 TaxID=1708203 RepID=A0A486XIF9_9GAMM
MLKEMDEDFTAVAKRFSNSHAGINVAVQLLPNEELKASVIRSAVQAVAPDIIIISSDNVGYARLMQLSELPDSMAIANLAKGVQLALQFEKKNYALPLFAGNHLLLMYNKKWVNQPVTDWQQLFDQHTSFAAKGVKTLALNYQEPYWFALFADLFGAHLIKDNAVNLNTVQMQQALSFYKTLVQRGVSQIECGYHCVSEAFYQGQFAYAINGSWALADARQRLGDNLGVAAFPGWQSRQIKPHASYIVMIFPHHSLQGAKATQIKQFVQYFRQHDNLQALADKHYLTPYFNSDSAVSATGDTLYKQVLAQTQQSQLMPASEAMVSVWNGMQKGMLLHQANTLNAAEAAAFMQKVAQRDQQLLAAGL